MKQKFLTMNSKVGAKNNAKVTNETIETYFDVTRSEELKTLVESIRSTKSEEERNKLKKQLPYRCPHYFEFKTAKA